MVISNFVNEATLFFKLLRTDFNEVGALFPTSSISAKALCSELRRHRGTKRVLEVGAGTGAITAELVKWIGPGDQLVVCELNPVFADFLRNRFRNEPEFKAVSAQSQIYEGSVLDLPADAQFDYIVSTIPFNNCPADFVGAVFAHYQRLLKAAGVLSYIEYIAGRTLKQFLGTDSTVAEVQALLAEQRQHFEFRKEIVVRNIPPAWIHHLRFGQATAADASALGALKENARMGIGPLGLDVDAVPVVAGLLGLAAWLRRRTPASRLWQWLALSALLVGIFFRDPRRRVLTNDRLAYAASDGVVLKVETLRDPRFGEEEWLRVAVFLSIFDVHLNRAPVGGKVVEILHEDGGHASANLESAEHNVAQYTVLETAHGRCIVAQRSGLIARRIVNRSKVGMLLAQGDKFGLIRFGSRTDIYLPAATYFSRVKKGDRVWGGETVIAEMKG